MATVSLRPMIKKAQTNLTLIEKASDDALGLARDAQKVLNWLTRTFGMLNWLTRTLGMLN